MERIDEVEESEPQRTLRGDGERSGRGRRRRGEAGARQEGDDDVVEGRAGRGTLRVDERIVPRIVDVDAAGPRCMGAGG